MKRMFSLSLRKSVAALSVAAALIPTTTYAQTLEQAVAAALDTNPQIRTAFNRFKAKEEQVNQASSGYLPTIDFNAGIGQEWTDSPSTRRDNLNYTDVTDDTVDLTRREIGISLRQMLFDGFRTSNEVDRTEFEASAEQWALYASAQDTALEVSQVYLAYLRAKQVTELAESNLESHQTIYDAIKEKTDSGFGTSADLAQISGRLARAQSNLISARNNLADTISTYRKLVNVAPQDTRLPVPDADMLPTSIEQALQLALDSHPTLKAAANDIEAADAQIDSSNANYFPQVTFELSANWNDNLDGSDGKRPTDVGGNVDDILAMVRVNYNLFNGGADNARKREAAYSYNEAKSIQQVAYRDVVEGTTLAWNANDYLQQQLEFLKQHVEAAAQTRDAYAEQFQVGGRTLIDMLDSENELFQARREYVTAEFDHIAAQYRLLNATGQLLASLRVTTPSVWQGEENYPGGVR